MKTKDTKKMTLSVSIISKLIFFASFMFLIGPAYAAPIISDSPINLKEGQVITINGTGFGNNGPNVLFFDNFESGTLGQNIQTGVNSATIGEWATINSYPPFYTNDSSVSGSKAFKSVTHAGTAGMVNGIITLPDVTEYYVSWWQYVPTGSPWSGEGEIQGMDWKTMWAYYNDTATNDVYFRMKLSPNTYGISSNDAVIPYPERENFTIDTMSKGTWYRFQWWQKSGYSGDGESRVYQTSSLGTKLKKTWAGKTTATSPAVYNKLSVNGHILEATGATQATQLFDDVYVATGASSQARVEIGTGCTGGIYTNCTNLSIATVNSWSDTTITATVQLGSLSGAFSIFVIDAKGKVSSGFPRTVFEPISPNNLRIIASY